MKTLRVTPFLILIALGTMLLTAVGSAHGQQTRDVPIGSFTERITTRPDGGDRSVVLLSPTGAQGDSAGQLLWGCAANGALRFGILRPQTRSSYVRTQPMTWTFDADAPHKAVIRRLTDSWSWEPEHEDVTAFTRRAQMASRLVIRLPDAAAGQDALYQYDLAGADSALGRLECVRSLRAVRAAPEVSAASPGSSASALDEQTYELMEVEELPGLANRLEFQRALMAGYPPSLREARVSGSVEIRFRVLEDGSVDFASITITSTDNELFNEPSIRAVRILRFRPAQVNGRPVKVWVTLPLVWTLGPIERPR